MEPTLYIIMRSDIPDLTPGKGMAQAAHAQADFDKEMQLIKENPASEASRKGITIDHVSWTQERTFGRTIVLSATEERIRDIATNGVVAGVTVDPTYPWRNYYGETFLTKEVTCGWLFVSDTVAEDANLVRDLPLHK